MSTGRKFKRNAVSICMVFFFAFMLSACGFGDSPVSVSVSETTLSLEVGETAQLSASASDSSAVSWSSSDTSVAEVSSDGKVTAKSAGSAVITASCGKALAACAVTVSRKQQATVTLSPTSLSLEVGQSADLTAQSSDGAAVVFSSGNSAVASVSSGGKVTAMSVGSAVITASCGGATATCAVTVSATSVITPPSGYTLVWNDEFSGTSLDMSKWSYQTGIQDYYGNSVGPKYWGNEELQYYTDGANLSVSDGSLKITAKRENMGDRQYTSSRIVTRDKGSWTYGYIEARIKSPATDGMWPAFWMLPQPSDKSSSDNVYGGWAANGELDIMEAKGRLKNQVDTTIHFGGSWPQNTYLGSTTELTSDIDSWHTYAVEWTAQYIAWIVDGKEVYRLTNDRYYSTASSNPSAPFDQPFFILLNLAVGGKYDSYVQPSGEFKSADMFVDYVRVFQKQ